MNDQPKISVITPCLNGAKYLQQAIESVLIQDYANFEHIVVDGNSTDGTIEILKKYSHLKWVSELDNGQSDAMNKGFDMSSGEVIVYLNSDDYFEPEAFKTAVKYLSKEEGIYFLVGECRTVDVDGKIIPVSLNPPVTLYEMLRWWKNGFPKGGFYFSVFLRTMTASIVIAIGNNDEAIPLPHMLTCLYPCVLTLFHPCDSYNCY